MSKANRRRRYAPPPTTQEPIKAAPLYSLDVGYGYTKILTPTGQHHLFPSLVAEGDLSTFNLGLVPANNTVIVDGVDYLVGDAALSRGSRFTEEYDSWWTSPRYKALIQYASQFIPAKSRVLTGLPLHIYNSVKAHQQVSDILRRGLRAQEITILPQGVGAFCYAIDQDPTFREGRTGLVDIGMRTTDLVSFSDGQYLPHTSSGLILGVGTIFREVAEQLSTQHGRKIDAYEVDWAVRGTRPLKIKGEILTESALTKLLQPCIKPTAERLFREMTHLWGPGAPSMDRLVFCGGGTTLFATWLSTFRSSYALLSNSQFANAAGYLQFGRWQTGQRMESESDVNGGTGHGETLTPEQPSVSSRTSVGER